MSIGQSCVLKLLDIEEHQQRQWTSIQAIKIQYVLCQYIDTYNEYNKSMDINEID